MRTVLATLGCLALACTAYAPSTHAQSTPAPPPTPAPGTAAPAPPPPMNVRTTRDLVNLCSTPDTDPTYPGAIGLCVGYGSGVLDFYLADTSARRRIRKVCIPNPPPTRGTARRMFVAWANEHPQYDSQPAVEGVMRFFIATFPCKR